MKAFSQSSRLKRQSALAVILLALGIASPARAETLSQDYEVTVNGRPIPVYACRVSAVPFNQVWPGYQRPLDQTESAGFASWDMKRPVKVVVQSQRAVQSVVVRPASRGIRPLVEGDRISFSVQRPGPIVVEVNGSRHALHLFANPPEKNAPATNGPGVRYFGPGVHHPGKINLSSNETVYLAAGAVVYGSLNGSGVSNIRILGRGILDGSQFAREEGWGVVRLDDCSNVHIEGIVMRDPDVWCCSLFSCRNVTIANVKLIGLWRYNADGIDVCNSQDVEVRDSFVRSFDDGLVVKGLKFGPVDADQRPAQNVRFRRCVVWCDWGRAMEIGAETSAPEISDIAFDDCDIIRTTHVAMEIQHGDRAAIRDIRFENIRVEVDDRNLQPRIQNSREEKYSDSSAGQYCPALLEIVIHQTPYSKDQQRGTVRAVSLRDIVVTGAQMPSSSFRGFDAGHAVEDVTIENLRFNGKRLQDASEARLQIGPHVRDVRFVDGAPSREEKRRSPPRPMELFVGPNGADINVGSKSSPLHTLEAARDRLRAAGGEGHTITLLPGTYPRSVALQLDARDAGLTLQGRPGARLIGGQILNGFAPVSNGAMLSRFTGEARPHIMQLDPRKLGITEFGELKSRGFGRPITPSHSELFFGGRPMALARWPNEGDWERIAGYPTNSATKDDGEQTIGKLEGGFFYEGDRPRRWSGRDDLWVHGYWAYDWANSYELVASIDVEQRLIKTEPPHGLYGFQRKQRFYFLNVPEELDQPGEWYLDRATATVYFWPPAPLGSNEAVLSLLDQPLVRMTNASGVKVRGIQFEATRGNAIEMTGGAGNRISGCRIRNIGNWAVRISGGTNHAVVSCDILDTGDGGVSLTGGDRQTLTPGGHSVENCHFQRQGRWSKCYVPAVTMDGVGLRAAHNLIHDQPHCAILFWGNEHLIEFNDIHHVAMETGDVGAIYTGRDYTFRGNRIRHNFIHETGGVGMGSMGVYMDDCVSGTEVFGNVFYKAHWAMFIGGGRDHQVLNNLFVDCDPAVRADGRGLDPHPVWHGQVDTTLRQRLAEVPAALYRTRYPALRSLDRFYGPPGGPARTGGDFSGVPPEGNVILRNVCLGKWLDVGWYAELAMFDVRNNSVQTNFPVTVVEGLRRMRDGSARKLGTVPIPFERIGLRRDAERKLLENLK